MKTFEKYIGRYFKYSVVIKNALIDMCMYFKYMCREFRLFIKNELKEHSAACCIVCALCCVLCVLAAIAIPKAIFISGFFFVLSLLFWTFETL